MKLVVHRAIPLETLNSSIQPVRGLISTHTPPELVKPFPMRRGFALLLIPVLSELVPEDTPSMKSIHEVLASRTTAM